MARRLLLLSCSKRKNTEVSPIPAVQRYDGPFFRTLRRAAELGFADDLDTYIVSARFGMLNENDEIPWYDEYLTEERKQEISIQVASVMHKLADPARFSCAFVCAGKKYMDLLAPSVSCLKQVFPVTLAIGGLGEKLTRLTTWLGHQKFYPKNQNEQSTGLKLRGFPFWATRNDIFAIVRCAIETGERQALQYRGWYVSIDGHRLSPKWLVYKASGIPVARFHTDDAKRILSALGFEVHAI